MDKVIIYWKDASMSSNIAAYNKEELDNFNLSDLKTCGWLAGDYEDRYTLAMEYNTEEGTFRHITAIPKICVTKVEYLYGKI